MDKNVLGSERKILPIIFSVMFIYLKRVSAIYLRTYIP